MNSDSKRNVDNFTSALIRRKAQQLARLARLSPQDREDIEQELHLHVLQRQHLYDATRGHKNAFLKKIVQNKAANLLRDRRAKSRDERTVSSLNVPVETKGEGFVELAQTICQHEVGKQRLRAPRSREELAQLTADVGEIVASLPGKWRQVAERRKTQTVTQIARDLGIPRTTVSGWISAIRKRFEKVGLKDYL